MLLLNDQISWAAPLDNKIQTAKSFGDWKIDIHKDENPNWYTYK